jgi:ribonuclease HII
MSPDFSFESKLRKNGLKIIAGMDEVGRGSFAGPIITACVIFPDTFFSVGIPDGILINDSKKLTHKQRIRANYWIKDNSLFFGIGSVSALKINKVGLKKASEIAFRKAVAEVNTQRKIDHLLMDAFYVPYLKGLNKTKQTPIVKGDQKSFSIAAASIVAKVYRDSLMEKLSKKYSKYGWDTNRGYGTKFHRQAILKHGTTKHHRNKFIETWLSKL